MRKSVSVAEARQNLARLIRTAEGGRAVEITRRGEPVAVLLSASEYLQLKGERPAFEAAIESVRDRHGVRELEIVDSDFEGLRDEAEGREVSL